MIEAAVLLAGMAWVAWRYRYGGPHYPTSEDAKTPTRKEP